MIPTVETKPQASAVVGIPLTGLEPIPTMISIKAHFGRNHSETTNCWILPWWFPVARSHPSNDLMRFWEMEVMRQPKKKTLSFYLDKNGKTHFHLWFWRSFTWFSSRLKQESIIVHCKALPEMITSGKLHRVVRLWQVRSIGQCRRY